MRSIWIFYANVIGLKSGYTIVKELCGVCLHSHTYIHLDIRHDDSHYGFNHELNHHEREVYRHQVCDILYDHIVGDYNVYVYDDLLQDYFNDMNLPAISLEDTILPPMSMFEPNIAIDKYCSRHWRKEPICAQQKCHEIAHFIRGWYYPQFDHSKTIEIQYNTPRLSFLNSNPLCWCQRDGATNCKFCLAGENESTN